MIAFDSNIILYIIVTIFYLYAFIVIVKSSIQNRSRGGVNDGEITINYTSMMKGIMAINIMLSHYTTRIDDIFVPYRILTLLGAPSVAVFLFISGYSETYQMKLKGATTYFEKFLRKKICRIYIPWIISVALFAVMFQITDPSTLVKGAFLFKTVYREDAYNWFVIIILYYYLAIFLYGLFSKNRRFKTDHFLQYILAISIIWFVICAICGASNHWYGNSFTFLFGCFAGKYHSKINQKFENHTLRNTIIFGGISVFLILGYCAVDNLILNLIGRVVSTFFISLFTWQLGQMVKTGDRVLKFLGKLSLEIFYLGTGFFIWYYARFAAVSYSIIFVFAAVIICAYLLNKFSSFATKRISGH